MVQPLRIVSNNEHSSITKVFIEHLETKCARPTVYQNCFNRFIYFMLEDPNFFKQKSLVDACEFYTESFLGHLQEQVNKNTITKRERSNHVKMLSLLYESLKARGLSTLTIETICPKEIQKENVRSSTQIKTFEKYKSYKTSSTKRSSQAETMRHRCKWFNTYLEDSERKQLASSRERKFKTLYFLKYLCSLNLGITPDECVENLTPSLVEQYELMLKQRINSEEITMSTAYTKLRFLKQFLDFLRKNKLVDFKYNISPYFYSEVNRDNEYVNREDLEAVIKTLLLSNSPYKLRDLTIILLIAETGCRPIEISNIKITDIHQLESSITLTSNKSGVRKLQINKTVMDVVKAYYNERIQVTAENDAFILLDNAQPITTESIGWIFYHLNIKTFGESRFSAKSLRHTYATNAIERNDFDKVSKTMGHKHWVSTMHYIYRSVERILANTMPYDPTISEWSV